MNRKSLSIFIILAVGVVLAVMILKMEPPTTLGPDGGDPHSTTQTEVPGEVRGTHGGRIFSKDDLKLEVTIYERNVPPQFRVYATNAQGNNIPLNQIKLNINLHRLGRPLCAISENEPTKPSVPTRIDWPIVGPTTRTVFSGSGSAAETRFHKSSGQAQYL